MPYYDTIEEDLARAKMILEHGRPTHEDLKNLPNPKILAAAMGGTIYGADIYAAYKLLESFVTEIERLTTARVLAEDIVRQVRQHYGDNPLPTKGSTTVYADAQMVQALEQHRAPRE